MREGAGALYKNGSKAEIKNKLFVLKNRYSQVSFLDIYFQRTTLDSEVGGLGYNKENNSTNINFLKVSAEFLGCVSMGYEVRPRRGRVPTRWHGRRVAKPKVWVCLYGTIFP